MDPDNAELHEEFAQLLEPQLDGAYRFAFHLSRDANEAEDLVQEAALLALRYFATYRRGSHFRAWFMRILLNKFYARARRSKPTVELIEQSDSLLVSGTDDGGQYSRVQDPSVELIASIDAETIAAAMACLPDDFRAVCAMYLVEDATYQEIADRLEIPIGTVRSRLHRGRRILQQALRDVAAERGIVSGSARSNGANHARR